MFGGVGVGVVHSFVGVVVSSFFVGGLRRGIVFWTGEGESVILVFSVPIVGLRRGVLLVSTFVGGAVGAIAMGWVIVWFFVGRRRRWRRRRVVVAIVIVIGRSTAVIVVWIVMVEIVIGRWRRHDMAGQWRGHAVRWRWGVVMYDR